MTQLLQMPDRLIHAARFQIDTNRINARQNLPNMNQLEKWAASKVISLNISQSAMQEVMAGHNLQRRQKTLGMVCFMTLADTSNERQDMQLVTNILFPGKSSLSPNEKKDVEIVFNARKHGYALVTNDGGSKKQPGGILGNRDDLKRQLQMDVYTDAEAVVFVRQKILSRDTMARRISDETGQKIPDWVGKD